MKLKMSIFTKLRIFCVATLCLASFSVSKPVFAQTPVLNLIPISFDATQLGYPGSPTNLIVEIKNTQDTKLKIRAVVTRDGEIMDIPVTNAKFDKVERLFYQVEVPSPKAELTYQFIGYDASGVSVTTPRITVRRNCIPHTQDVVLDSKAELTQDEFIVSLEDKAKGLEKEIGNREYAVKMLLELKDILVKPEGEK